MKDFTKIINPATVPVYGRRTGQERQGQLYIEIKWQDGQLTLSGVEAPLKGGDCLGSCGQVGIDAKAACNEGWNRHMLYQLAELWDRWHLNDMNAGSPAQETFVRHWRKTHEYGYVEAKAALDAAGLEPDIAHPHNYTVKNDDGVVVPQVRPYSYGTAWVHEPVPEHVLEWLYHLPDTPVQPAWV